jgi:hypothetical protein
MVCDSCYKFLIFLRCDSSGSIASLAPEAIERKFRFLIRIFGVAIVIFHFSRGSKINKESMLQDVGGFGLAGAVVSIYD